ncbi:MAG: MBL fold metallo-hydrolase [Verrucomicrobiota bacterium]
MLEVTVLASGSSGNALLVRSGACSVLVDAGLSARRLATGVQSCGIAPESLSGILLTHEHGDHTKGLKVFVQKFDVPVFANPLTVDHLKRQGIAARWNLFSSGAGFMIENIEVLPFSVPHDAADPVGFVLRSASGTGFAVLTDLGYATRQVVESVRGVHALLIETNHDEALLQGDTKRPWSVKQRILSRHGHLSNSAAAEIVAEVATGVLRHVLLGHLSRDCNTPDLAVQTVGSRLQAGGHPTIEVQCARADEEAPMIRIVI